MRKNRLRRALTAGAATAVVGASLFPLTTVPAAAAAPGDLEICHGPDYALSAEFPERGGLKTAIRSLPWRERNCHTFEFDVTEGETIKIHYVTPDGGGGYLMTVAGCGGGHRIWSDGNVVKSLSCKVTEKAQDLPPKTWKEHWFEHDQLLRRIDYNDSVALYFDKDVDPGAKEWLMPFLTDMWRYVQKTYGKNTGKLADERLYSIHHEGRYFGGHPATVDEESHDYRNVSDVGLADWSTPQYGIITHEVGHIVEFAGTGKEGSPAFGLWGDSKWAEFFIFDVYAALGMKKEAQAVYNGFMNKVDDFPREDTHWFRDWFFPLWRDHGHAEVMVRFFDLVGKHFPAEDGKFTRGMNWGEYVHFTSGAAGKNLKAMASRAFGWPQEWEAQFVKAQKEFPEITY